MPSTRPLIPLHLGKPFAGWQALRYLGGFVLLQAAAPNAAASPPALPVAGTSLLPPRVAAGLGILTRRAGDLPLALALPPLLGPAPQPGRWRLWPSAAGPQWRPEAGEGGQPTAAASPASASAVGSAAPTWAARIDWDGAVAALASADGGRPLARLLQALGLARAQGAPGVGRAAALTAEGQLTGNQFAAWAQLQGAPDGGILAAALAPLGSDCGLQGPVDAVAMVAASVRPELLWQAALALAGALAPLPVALGQLQLAQLEASLGRRWGADALGGAVACWQLATVLGPKGARASLARLPLQDGAAAERLLSGAAAWLNLVVPELALSSLPGTPPQWRLSATAGRSLHLRLEGGVLWIADADWALAVGATGRGWTRRSAAAAVVASPPAQLLVWLGQGAVISGDRLLEPVAAALAQPAAAAAGPLGEIDVSLRAGEGLWRLDASIHPPSTSRRGRRRSGGR